MVNLGRNHDDNRLITRLVEEKNHSSHEFQNQLVQWIQGWPPKIKILLIPMKTIDFSTP